MCCSLKGTYKALASAWPDGFFVLSTVCRTTEKHEATNVLQRSRKSKDDEQRRFNQCPLPEKEKKNRNNTKNDFFKCENMKQARSIYQRSTKRRPPLR